MKTAENGKNGGEGSESAKKIPNILCSRLDNTVFLHYNIIRIKKRPWLSWIERLATDQKVGGSNPSGRATKTGHRIAMPCFCLFARPEGSNPVRAKSGPKSGPLFG